MKVVPKNYLSQVRKRTDQSPIYITGPTGVGKSAFATLLSLRLGGEIIGADAFQIYNGLPILTAQPTSQEQRGVPHHLIGTLPLDQSCDAANYSTMAQDAIKQVRKNHHIPIITGGTGLYIRSLISPLDKLPKADAILRASFTELSIETLLARLEELDPNATTLIDHKNRRRVERALEIVILTGSPLHKVWQKKKESLPISCGFFLFREREELYQRIEVNVHKMFTQGVAEEIQALDSLEVSPTASQALGFQEIRAYLRGEKSLETTIKKISQLTKHYAKRQLTWFKNQHDFFPLNLSNFSSMEEALEHSLIVNEVLKAITS